LAACTEVQSWDPGRGIVESIALARDPAGRLLLASSDEHGVVTVGQPLSGEPSDVFTSQAGEPILMTWGYQEDGQPLLATRSEDAVQVWDAETGELLHTTSDPVDLLAPVAWAYLPDGRAVLAVGSRGTVMSIYDPVSGEKLQSAPGIRNEYAWTLSWGCQPDGHPLLITCTHEGVSVWSEHDGEFFASVLTERVSDSAAWAPLADGRMLLATTTGDSLQLWDMHGMSLLHEAPMVSGNGSTDILDWVATPDGRLLLANAGDARRIRVWDVVLDPPARWTGDPPRSRGDRAWGDGVRARAESRLVADDDRPPPPVVLTSITETRTWGAEAKALGVDLCVALDGRVLLATGSQEDRSVRIWDADSGEMLVTLTGHTANVVTVAWGHGADGQLLLASGSNDGTARIWNPETGECLHRLAAPARSGGSHAQLGYVTVAWGYSAEGRSLLATGCTRDAIVGIWDPGTGELLRALDASSGYDLRSEGVYSVSWGYGLSGELTLASASAEDNTVQLWDPDSGAQLQVLTGHRDAVRATAWATRPDGRPVLATAAYEETTIRLWTQADDGEFTAEEHDPGLETTITVSWVSLSDGRLLLVGCSEHALFVLDGHTFEMLRTVPGSFGGRGLRNLGWVVTPDGRLLLSATSYSGQIYVWDVALDPPVPPSSATPGAQAVGPASLPARPHQRGRVLESPEEVTPRFEDAEGPTIARFVRCATRADGHILMAAAHSDDSLRIWDASTGALVHVLPLPYASSVAGSRFAWERLQDGRLVLALLRPDGSLQIWDPDTAQPLQIHSSDPTRVSDSIEWIHDRDGRPLLATGTIGSGAEAIQIWDPETGELIYRLSESGEHWLQAVTTEGRLPDGRQCLVTGMRSAPVRIWDADSGELVRELSFGGTQSAAWGHGPDGRPELAIGRNNGTISICDPATGDELRTLTGHSGYVRSLKWASSPEGPSILVSAADDNTARTWDPVAGTELARLSCPSRGTNAIDIARSPDGDLLLFVADGDSAGGDPARVWRIATGPPSDPAAAAARPTGRLTAQRIAGSARRLLRVGSGALWPPLGLIADLVTLTGPDGDGRSAALCDPRLAAVSGEPGVSRLRDLAAREPRWSADARAGFAALLASGLDLPGQYAPPAGADPADLRDELATALAGRIVPLAGQNGPWQVPVAALRAAVGAITEQVIMLLEILGPPACAADPLLPARLAHRARELPALSPRELRLLAAAGTQRPANGANAAAGTLLYSPGTAGVARSGPLTRLLPTQLALPAGLLTMRLAENQLLYRQHQAPAPPAPEPVTIILDTTPPTFGPAGNCLRLAAHLLTLTLWAHGRHPALVTLADPESASELRAPADLIRLWTSATLDPPAALLPGARRTAAGLGQPAVLCAHYRTASDGEYFPGPASRLLTTHQPPEKPRVGETRGDQAEPGSVRDDEWEF
jgi:WD40 repeat protein